MTDEPDHNDKREALKRPRVSRWAIVRSVGGTILTLSVTGAIVVGLLGLFHPDTPLAREWNPTTPLRVVDPVTPFTMWKLRMTLKDPEQCNAVLQEDARAGVRSPREDSDQCHIRNRVSIDQIGGSTTISPAVSETSCATALRLVMWEQHGLQPAAQEFLQSEVSTIRQIGSYNCRPIRNSSGTSTRWSTHATADAIDITGFDFKDGRRIRLIADWDDGTDEGAFLRAVRDSACTWFATTLSPDYNSLHADHFHLQARGWGTCR